MAFKIVRNDLTKVQADIIVNSANPKPICGGSTEAIVYRVAGYDKLLEARQKVGRLEIGQIGVTPGFALPAEHIIHVSCPWWNDGDPESVATLRACYKSVLDKALEIGAKSIVFPLLSSGVYRFPKKDALEIAVGCFKDFESIDLEITLVVYDEESFNQAKALYGDVPDFVTERKILSAECCYDICEQDVLEKTPCLAGRKISKMPVPRCLQGFAVHKSPKPLPKGGSTKWDEEINSVILNMDEDTFQDKLFGYVKERNMSAKDVYIASNINRKLYSKIKKDGYRPGKYTVLALAVGLRLDYDETIDLLSRVDYAFSPSSKRDEIIKYFIMDGAFYEEDDPIGELNDCLNSYQEEVLGEGID